MPAADAQPPFPPDFDPQAIFHDNGPIDPVFMRDAVLTVMRTLPNDPQEPRLFTRRRMFSLFQSVGALRPRDEIEVMLAVQGLAAYHAAAACWRLGMNHHHPNGDSTRHITAAATAARTFDTILRALERRQAKALPFPNPPRIHATADLVGFERGWEDRVLLDEARTRVEDNTVALPVWTQRAITIANDLREQDRADADNEGLDIANTEGIMPGGGMIVPENPTPEQEAYLGRRLGLQVRREHEENLRKGIRAMPKIRSLRPGDFVP